MSTEIAVVKKQSILDAEEFQHFDQEVKNELIIMMKAGVFSDSKEVHKSIAKVIIGRSMGLSPDLAVRGIILQSNGLPSFTANLMATLIKTSGKYDYSMKEIKDEKQVCTAVELTVEKKRDGQWIHAGTTTFGLEDAKIAGLAGKDTFKKFPRNMYFARAISNAAKWFCPDVFGGYTAYTPDEIPGGPEVDGATLELAKSNRSDKKPVVVADAEVDLESHQEMEMKCLKLLKETGSSNLSYFDHFQVNSFNEMTYDQLKQMVSQLEKVLRAQKI